MLSDMPNWRDKGCTLQTFVRHYDSTVSPPFCSEIPTLVVLEYQSYSQFHRCSCLLQIQLPFSVPSQVPLEEVRSQTELPYSRTVRTRHFYADSLTSCAHADKLRLRKPRIPLAFVQILLTCVYYFKSLVIVMPRYMIF